MLVIRYESSFEFGIASQFRIVTIYWISFISYANFAVICITRSILLEFCLTYSLHM